MQPKAYLQERERGVTGPARTRRKPSADKLDHHDDPQTERRSTRTCRAVGASQGVDEIVAHPAVEPQRAECLPAAAVEG
jgi:hypothetical protein